MVERLIASQIPKMIKLLVVEKNSREYLLVDEDNNKYLFNLCFYETDMDFKYIYMSCELLDPTYYEYSKYYNFGPLGKSCARKLSTSTIQDLIVLEDDNNKIYLQRYYG